MEVFFFGSTLEVVEDVEDFAVVYEVVVCFTGLGFEANEELVVVCLGLSITSSFWPVETFLPNGFGVSSIGNSSFSSSLEKFLIIDGFEVAFVEILETKLFVPLVPVVFGCGLGLVNSFGPSFPLNTSC